MSLARESHSCSSGVLGRKPRCPRAALASYEAKMTTTTKIKIKMEYDRDRNPASPHRKVSPNERGVELLSAVRYARVGSAQVLSKASSETIKRGEN